MVLSNANVLSGGATKMKKLLVAGIVLSLAGASGALAADMATPKPMYTKAPVVMVQNWGGFYVGGEAGARWSRSRWTSLDFDLGLPPSVVDNPANLDKTGFFGGGYIGYNWTLAPAWLVGLEADIGWGGGTATHAGFPGASSVVNNSPGHDSVSVKLDWSGTARGRLGYLVTPTWLVYGTGGVAWQQITTSASCDANIGAGSFCSPPAISESSTVIKTGWTVGGGVETMLWGNWIGRAQYLYADFGTVSNRFPAAPGIGFHANIAGKTNTAVLGLAYKF
jgi:outer membrane immunogenic protein